MDQPQIDARVVEAHHLVDHRKLQVGARVVDGYASRLDEGYLDEQVCREQHHDGQVQVERLFAGEDVGERGVAAEHGQRGETYHQGRFDQRAVKGFARSSHALERTARVHRREDDGGAGEGQCVGETYHVALERDERIEIGHGDEQHGRHGRAEVYVGGDAEQRRGSGRVYRAFAEQQRHAVHVVEEAHALAACEYGAGTVYHARGQQGHRYHQDCIECSSHTLNEV